MDLHGGERGKTKGEGKEKRKKGKNCIFL